MRLRPLCQLKTYSLWRDPHESVLFDAMARKDLPVRFIVTKAGNAAFHELGGRALRQSQICGASHGTEVLRTIASTNRLDVVALSIVLRRR